MSLFTGNHFYWQQTKTFITAFGSIFQDIAVEKMNADGVTVQQYEVPIDYSPKNKWLTLVAERPDYTTNQVQMTLPRMAFEITDMKPNMSRKIGFNGTYAIGTLSNGSRTKIFNPAPIDLTVELYVIARDNEDMFQIIEQIIPFFQPMLILNINQLPEYNIYKDIPISLLSITTQDNYTGAADEQRLVESTLTFNVPMYYFGPIDDRGSIIKDVKVGLSTEMGKVEDYEAKVEPITANKTDPENTWTISETWK